MKNLSTNNIDTPLLLKTINKEKTSRAPVWLMRQAGRYMPEYMKIRKKYTFKTMYSTPEIATEITLQPIQKLQVDAAILFSDILVLPEACGLELDFIEKKGPVFQKTIQNKEDIERLKNKFHINNLKFVFETLSCIKPELPKDTVLIGFAGSPFTVACYMIDGHGKNEFKKTRYFYANHPELMHELLDFLSDVTIEYCLEQIKCGAEVIQIFDTWGSILNQIDYVEFSLKYIYKIMNALQETSAFTTYFSKNTLIYYEDLKKINMNVLSTDSSLNIQEVKKLFPEICIQGNLDPYFLYLPKPILKNKIINMLHSNTEKKKYIANLGHGIFPDVPVDHVKFFVDTVKEESLKFYSQ